MLGPQACRTFYSGPFGILFLSMEGLIYDLPYFKVAAAQTNLKDEVKSLGIDLDGSKKIKC